MSFVKGDIAALERMDTSGADPFLARFISVPFLGAPCLRLFLDNVIHYKALRHHGPLVELPLLHKNAVCVDLPYLGQITKVDDSY